MILRAVAAMAVLSTRSGQMARFGLRMVDFILSRIRSSSAARPSHFYQGLAKRIAVLSRPASRSGRLIKADGSFIKAGQPMAVLSTMAALSRLRTRPQWPLYQSEAAKSPDLLDLQSRWPFYQVLLTMPALSRSRTRPVAAMAVLSIRSGQMARSVRFGLRMVDFILPCKRSLSAAKQSNFYQGLAKRLAVL